jgi:DNA-binding beta-propeller fold protein YncE
VPRGLILVFLAACTPDTGGSGGGAGRLDCATSGHVCTVAGTGERGWSDDGLAATASHLFLPTDVAEGPDGAMWVVDYNNMRVRRVTAEGTFETVAGSGIHAYATDGIVAVESALENPVSLAVAADGVAYITEQHGARVLRLDDGWLEVYAGDAESPGYEGWDGDGGPARDATMSQSIGLALADDGTLYIGDTRNERIRVVSPDGIMGTLAGSGESDFIDADAENACFFQPHHIALGDGVLYVADAGNHAVRAVDLVTGAVTTVAGMGEPGFSGDGGLGVHAHLDTPQGVAVGLDGELYIADSENHVVRVLYTDGTLDTFAGQPGEFGLEGDGGPVEEALLQWPTNVTVTRDGRLWIADTLNSVVREVVP